MVDASVALKWFFRERDDEPGARSALDLLKAFAGGRVTLVQPPHFVAEVVAVLARDSPSTAAASLRDLLDLDLTLAGDAPVYARGLALSLRLRQHLFDTLYHAVAIETPGALLVTADERYWRKAQHEGRIAFLGAFSVAP